ncbi:YesN/AraC family two-component response regulator [Lactobacillus colini]|uniref:YesN/AraC family two-component response regulator n=1 Tax=Lactobacillus colini TaxID=1819254 RepID=A0ABS4MHC4_9LACO|nr:AraC family transcriptional regulator [Lactobacillus colini]MBP2058993.1 YesN/AraC family two-component response regulator [Lactobacillus colini]
MTVIHEEVQNTPRLPFYFYDSTNPFVKEHWHQGIEINYLIEGNDLQFVLKGTTFHFNAGDIWIVNHNQVHSASSISKNKIHYVGLIIDDDFLLSEFPSSANWNLQLMGKSVNHNYQAYQKISELLINISKKVKQKITDPIRFEILADFFQIIAILDQYFNQPQDNSATLNSPLVNELITYINNHHRENVSASSISHKFGISQVTLNSQLKQSNYMSVGKYLNLTRLLDARQLLLNTNKPIAVIANEVGFSDSKVLNRNFKKWKNKTPSQYRNTYAKYHSKAYFQY